MTGTRRWGRKAEVAWVDSPDRVALLDLDHLDRPPVILEQSSSLIWSLLADELTEDALVERVATYYDMATGEVAGPVHDFLRQMLERGLVTMEESGP
jgi:hypothetical protein